MSVFLCTGQLISRYIEKEHVPNLDELDAMLEPESKDGLEFKSQPQPDRESRWWEQLRKNLAGSGVLLKKCVDTVLSMYSILRECGKVEKDELLDAVDIDATEYASCDSVWSNMVKGKDTLSALSGVKTSPTGRHNVWRYNNG